jgi:hypothetical protein
MIVILGHHPLVRLQVSVAGGPLCEHYAAPRFTNAA